jgi:hypothetical protein
MSESELAVTGALEASTKFWEPIRYSSICPSWSLCSELVSGDFLITKTGRGLSRELSFHHARSTCQLSSTKAQSESGSMRATLTDNNQEVQMKASHVLPWIRPHRSWKQETLNMASAAGLGMLVGALIGGRKGATIGATSASFARWVRWWAGR